ncbi:MAG: hypothetical protein QNJ73_05510 [Gammaproteobacteria bacterium]|nr:hypothetical protein [Gammaproteobacteria bacterium]
MRGDRGYFDWVADELRTAYRGGQISVNPTTAGILIDRLPAPLVDLQTAARRHQWFDLELPGDRERAFGYQPPAAVDARFMAVTALLSMAAYQILRGEIWGPATGYLWDVVVFLHLFDHES